MMKNSIDELAQDKLTILYILEHANTVNDDNTLTNYILKHEIMNFFSLKQYVSELFESKLLVRTDDAKYILTEKGKLTLELLMTNFPEEHLEKLQQLISKDWQTPEKKVAVISPKPNGEFLVKLYLTNELDEDFMLRFTAASVEMANQIKKYWESSSTTLYNEIMNMVSNFKED